MVSLPAGRPPSLSVVSLHRLSENTEQMFFSNAELTFRSLTADGGETDACSTPVLLQGSEVGEETFMVESLQL